MSAGVPLEELAFREGRASDVRDAFGLAERALHATAVRLGITEAGAPDEETVEREWQRERPLVEFLAAQDGSRFEVCEGPEGLVGWARVVPFGAIEELTDIMVDPDWHGRGVGRELMRRCWPGAPTPEVGRVVIAAGSAIDLSLYMGFGVMPITGHWHMVQRTEEYVERRLREQQDSAEPAVVMLNVDHAMAEWKRLEPPAIGHERPLLHEFFGRERICLGCLEEGSGEARGLCWVSSDGDIGPGVGAVAEELVPVVLAALDRVAKMQEPEELHLFCTTDSWWLLRRLRALGFRVTWPSWVMCSMPLPGLDRYVPTRPPVLL